MLSALLLWMRGRMATLETQVGALIRHHRRQAGLKQTRLAEIVEMQIGSLSRIERGKAAPSFATLTKLAEALGVEVRDFFELGNYLVREGRDDPLAEMVELIASAPAKLQKRALKTVRALIDED